MPESDFAEAMTPHKPTFVHKAADAYDTSLAGVLPHRDITSIGQHGFFLRIHRNHQLVVVNLSQQMLVVEIAEGIE